MYSIEHLSERTRNMIASLVSGYDDARVVVTERSPVPLAVALNPRMIALQAGTSGLFDLVLGAELIRCRAKLRKLATNRDAFSTELTRTFFQKASESLRNRYANVMRLSGFYREPFANDFANCDQLPVLSWNSIPWRPLDRIDANLSSITLPGLDVDDDGESDDWMRLMSAIDSGRYPLTRIAELPEIAIATVPGMILTGNAPQAELERLETEVSLREPIIKTFSNCYRRSSEGRPRHASLRERKETGAILDRTRLARAYVAARTGRPARVYTRRSQQIDRHWNPQNHQVLATFDLASIAERRSSLSRPRWSLEGVAATYAIFRRLGVRFGALAFRDLLVRRRRGGYVLIHAPYWIKKFSEPFDAAVWNRLVSFCQSAHSRAGIPVSFPPIQLRTARAALAADRTGDESRRYTSLSMISLQPFPDDSCAGSMDFGFDSVEYQDNFADSNGDFFDFDPDDDFGCDYTNFGTDFYRRIANNVESQLSEMHRQFQGVRLDTGYVFIAPEVIDQAPAKSRVAALRKL